MEEETEIWKGISNFPSYEVSNKGNVRNVASGNGRIVNKVLNPRAADLGHLSVCLFENGVSKMMQVHRLVALTFIGEPPAGKNDVAHYDGNPQNNNLENLRWASRSENENDKIRHNKSNRGERHGLSKLTENEVLDIREMAFYRFNNSEIAKEFNISREHVRDIVNRKKWKHLKEL